MGMGCWLAVRQGITQVRGSHAEGIEKDISQEITRHRAGESR